MIIVKHITVAYYYHIEAETKWLPFVDDILIFVFLYENCCVLSRNSPKFVHEDPVDNKSAFIQVKNSYNPVQYTQCSNYNSMLTSPSD